jgi:CelD/BcsL family acetyltransferase involved in cellulose biosynthesis
LAETRFLSEIAERGWLRCYVLRNDQRPFAFALGYQYNGVYYFVETGFVQRDARYGPGIVLMQMFIEDLFRRNTPQLFDYLQGDQGYKRSFSNAQHKVNSLLLAPRNRWRRILTVQRGLFAAERWGRSVVTLLKLDRSLRRFLQSIGADVRRFG